MLQTTSQPEPDTRVTPALVLNVQRSAGLRRWVWRHPVLAETDNRLALALAQKMDISELAARILAGRGISAGMVESYLRPRLRDALPNPSILRDMDATALRLAAAVQARATIGILGDYDVDGACGTALLSSTLTALGCHVVTHIPDRLAEGYGPNIPALQSLLDQGASLLVCVDCGTAAIDVLDHFEGQADRIVLDHHKPDGRRLPKGLVVNPNRLDCESGLGHLCATAVAFLTVVALQRTLRQQGWFETHHAPDPMALLDLTALATICDVMPLQGLNRALVAQGLKVMNRRERIGLAALANVAGVKANASAMSCGFALGPRINAGGRIARADQGLRLLLSQSEHEAQAIAEELDDINRKRQTVESHILDAAVEQAREQVEAGHAVIFLHGDDWHPGVVGIVAGRLKERFNRPALVGALKDGVVKGSARSVTGLDIGAAIIQAHQSGLLLTGGGHAMAAGFSVKEENCAALHARLDEALDEARHLPPQDDLLLDGVVTIRGATPTLAQQIALLAPFGPGNEEPLLAIRDVRCVKADRIGQDGNTLRVILQDADGYSRIKGLVFRAGDKHFTDLLEDRSRPLLHVAGQLRLETWQERENLTFFIFDAARA
ncbi:MULTISPECIES: single-stranded-DNA-specific exonuclease RecJ [unclassified Parasaccharibacter]|uniref:single-stranded-DNA-specific exonuclease RecJ n=1 Tax=unclassified Parasaccharibacter TaxID=2626400 RepID=UPI0020146D3B|nr:MULTISPECIES: single-stranded-DNA-specific exonuclease RecJ [unclassified Parasaccharibacter]MCL1515991.1 single-stranded-DNA-specific exonuclease RecJ [Parasaccharibacter sp. TMW2.1890]UPO80594.1 single-stranded-DNA-specific exonuclease RecJ [Parasaccharibacter sp. TMW 2.1888]